MTVNNSYRANNCPDINYPCYAGSIILWRTYKGKGFRYSIGAVYCLSLLEEEAHSPMGVPSLEKIHQKHSDNILITKAPKYVV